MRIKVRYFTTLRELAGNIEEEMNIDDDMTLAQLIEEVALRYGEKARAYLYHKEETIDPAIYLLINGTDYRMLSGLETKLKDGDVVAIIPPIGGG